MTDEKFEICAPTVHELIKIIEEASEFQSKCETIEDECTLEIRCKLPEIRAQVWLEMEMIHEYTSKIASVFYKLMILKCTDEFLRACQENRDDFLSEYLTELIYRPSYGGTDGFISIKCLKDPYTGNCMKKDADLRYLGYKPKQGKENGQKEDECKTEGDHSGCSGK